VQDLKLLLVVGGFRMRGLGAFPANKVQAVQLGALREECLVSTSAVSPNLGQEAIYYVWSHK